MKKYLLKAQRVMCLLLCAALVLSNVTFLTASAAGDNTVVDPHTLDQWKNYFGVRENDANNVHLSTEYAGGVWTDKSVFDPDSIPAQLTDAKYNGKSFAITDKGDNFLVSLSAIASNKQIKGYSTIPTDTVLVLDLSSSMRYTDDDGTSAVDELIAATNKAIDDLLKLNHNNRVAVVVYAGNTNKSFSSAEGITQIALPLDSYTTTRDGVYLIADPETVTQRVQIRPGRWENQEVPNTNPYGLAVYSGVKNSAGGAVNRSFEVSTGTYMQDGIYEAMKLFRAADPVVQEGVQIGTTRLPIMVLMTDGESTLANSDYNGNNARTDLGSSELYDYDGNTGNVGGYSYGHRDTISFMTSLTAAFAKKAIKSHYGEDPLFYTLPYGNAVLNRAEALSVLDPANASDIQNQLWTRFLNGEEVTVYRYWSGNAYRYLTVENSSVAEEKLAAADRLYVDKYFPASNDDAMLRAFEDIVEEIIIQSKYYPTYVEGSHDHDGYLTFVDKIGAHMEVSDVKGIVIGNRLFSGAALSSAFNASQLENPNAQARELIRSVMERLKISNVAIAEALLKNAFEQGQISHTSDQEFSHYIGWYSNARGEYVDFWHEGIQTAVPADATHIIKSYGFLGDTTVIPGVSNTDMMFMTVRIATEIATGNSIVTWRIPASLIPTLTYDVEVEVDSKGVIQRLTDLAMETATAESPIRLLYEVELERQLQDWNLAEKMKEANYTQKSGNAYVFYSNKWSATESDTTQNTYSHFEPSQKNERYYYTQDNLVYVSSGADYAVYTGSKPSGRGYYHAYQVYEKLNNGTLRTHTHYEAISEEAMESVEAFGNDQWVIPKGTVHRYYDYERTEKEQSAENTNTMGYSDYPFIHKDQDVYYTYSTQGNNGKLLVTPATGIRLTKELAEGYQGAGPYTFKITGGDLSTAQVVRLDSAGNEASRTPLAANGELSLAGKETVYIVGLQAETYTIEELIPADAEYKLSKVEVENTGIAASHAVVTPAEQKISAVEFTNTSKETADLNVSKDVNYPAGFVPATAHNEKEFTIKVTFNGDITGMIVPAHAEKSGNTYTLKLKDGDSATFGNIREGVTYTAEEIGLTTNYSLKEIRYSDTEKAIQGGEVDQIHVVNDYTPSPITADITIKGLKTIVSNSSTWPVGASFTFRLLEVTDLSSGTVIDTGLKDTVENQSEAGYEIDMSKLPFDRPGTYYFRVAEDIPANEEDRIDHMAYDRTFGLFAVIVTDENADGALEIKDVQAYSDTVLAGDKDNGWIITKNFTNVIAQDRVYLEIQKNITDQQNRPVTEHLADIAFGLFADQNANSAPVYYGVTDGNGKATLVVPVNKSDLGTAGLVYYLREIAPEVENRVVGMHYNEDWLYRISITWDDGNNKALVVYDDLRDSAPEQPHDANTVYTHTNTYTAGTTALLELAGTKTLNGNADLGDRTFTFELYNSTAAFVLKEKLAEERVNGTRNTFGFTREIDTPGMHYMVVKERASNLGGITNDPAEYHVTALVEKYSENGETKLRVADGYPIVMKYGTTDNVGSGGMKFNNTYTISGDTSVVIGGTKTLQGRPMLNAEFRFVLKEINEDGTDKVTGITLRGENGPATGEKATFAFEKITYTEPGTHYYHIFEQHSGETINGVTYSRDVYRVRVDVKDNGVGGLTSSWRLDEYNGAATNLPAEISFTNVYTPADATLKIGGTKDLEGKDLAEGEFTFRLTETDSTFENAVGTPKEKANDVHGLIEFEPLSYSNSGTHYYVVEEVIPATPATGVIYDETEFQVTVEVADDHLGQLKATITSIVAVTTELQSRIMVPVSSVAFTNHYDAKDAVLTIQGTKELSGREIEDGEFIFELYAVEDGDEANTPLRTAENVGNTFNFGDIIYGAEGTYTYAVKEKKGEDSTITYDTTVYTLTVEVKDENGELKATLLVDGEEEKKILFKNTYQKPQEPSPGGEGPSESAPAPQDPPKEPTVELPPVAELPEVIEPEALPPVKKPVAEKPKAEIPDTGDHQSLSLWIALFFVSGAGIITVLAAKKREEQE